MNTLSSCKKNGKQLLFMSIYISQTSECRKRDDPYNMTAQSHLYANKTNFKIEPTDLTVRMNDIHVLTKTSKTRIIRLVSQHIILFSSSYAFDKIRIRQH